MIKISQIYYTVIIYFIFICCAKKETTKLDVNNNARANQKIQYVTFPDTVLLNKNTFGTIKYNLNDLDTLKLSNIDERFTFCYITTDKNAVTLEQIKKSKHIVSVDTLQNGNFPFELFYSKSGPQLLNACIEDIIILKGLDKNGLVKIRTFKTGISKDIFVK